MQVLPTAFVTDEPRPRKKHQSRYSPDPNAKPIKLMVRDLDIMRNLYVHRVLSTEQLTQLYTWKKSAAALRLQKLFNHHFIWRVFFSVQMGDGSSPTLYVLNQRGVEYLRNNWNSEIKWHPSDKKIGDLFKRHTVSINDVMVAATVAARDNPNLEVHWKPERQVKADYNKNLDRVPVALTEKAVPKPTPVTPDSMMTVTTPKGRLTFFLELDGNTQSQKSKIRRKILAYKAYWERGNYTEKYGRQSFRVLFVTTGKSRRLKQLRNTAADISGAKFVWITRLTNVTPETLFTAPIWYHSGSAEPEPLIK